MDSLEKDIEIVGRGDGLLDILDVIEKTFKTETNSFENLKMKILILSRLDIRSESDFYNHFTEIENIILELTRKLSLNEHNHTHIAGNPQYHAHVFKNGVETSLKITIIPKSREIYIEEHSGKTNIQIEKVSQSSSQKKKIIAGTKKIFESKIGKVPDNWFASPSKKSVCIGSF